MRVKLLKMIAGPDGVFWPGEHDFQRTLAEALVAGGYAHSLEAPCPIIEQATVVIPLTADTVKRGRKKVSHGNHG
jgi:hypothetical protein